MNLNEKFETLDSLMTFKYMNATKLKFNKPPFIINNE